MTVDHNVLEMIVLMLFVGLTANRLTPVIYGSYKSGIGKDLIPAVLSIGLALVVTQAPELAVQLGLHLPALNGGALNPHESLIVILGAYPVTKLWYELQKLIRRGDVDTEKLLEAIDKWVDETFPEEDEG